MDTGEDIARFNRQGYFLCRGLVDPSLCQKMEAEVRQLTETAGDGGDIGNAYVVEESALGDRALPVERLSKLFRVHREVPLFRTMAESDLLLDRVEPILGPGIDCFLSQFIFKYPGALGQPWHQDSLYFPFDRGPQVGVWIAITRAHESNGPLSVLPGSHTEPVHQVIRDKRAHANPGYFEIVDHDMQGAQMVLMAPGDVLFFHSHLMHKSTDNLSSEPRAAMVFHYASGGTRDHSVEKYGRPMSNVDWMPVRRKDSH